MKWHKPNRNIEYIFDPVYIDMAPKDLQVKQVEQLNNEINSDTVNNVSRREY
jgi:hypothetical protein